LSYATPPSGFLVLLNMENHSLVAFGQDPPPLVTGQIKERGLEVGE